MRRVIRAAAGCGKTTALAQAYLQLIREGHQVDKVIAITFTRRAAAELVERVGLALRAATGDEQAVQALGSAAGSYLAAAPEDPELARAALADLGSAPIGTTDAFVNELLAEFALHAELQLPDGRTVPLDIGLHAVPDLRAHLDASARMLIDPPDSEPPPEVEQLTPYFTLGELHALLIRPSDLDALPVASCTEVLAWMARQIADALLELDLQEALKVQEGDWLGAVERVSNAGCEWTHAIVAQWLAEGAPPALAPTALVSWVRKIHKGKARSVWNVLQEQVFDFGVTRVRMDTVLEALKHPYEDPAHLQLADELREAVEALRVQVASDALVQAALQGELSHDHLTRCAARLAASRAVEGRFSALLVDEIQDANPDQLALYEALSVQPGMQSVFVGDGRQSIYLFRGGEPAGLERLTESTANVERTLTNYRSTPELVQAHQVLFECLDAPMGRNFLEPLEPLTSLASDPRRAEDRLDAKLHGDDRPVHIVWGDQRRSVETADAEAVRAFWHRVQIAWSEPGHGDDTAAILCPTWRSAREARDLLRQLSGDEDLANLEGGDHWLRDGVGNDVHLWLRALSDPHDDIAWLGVLKHPSIGLTDGALARVRSTRRTLGHLVHSELDATHDPRDRFAFERARGPLLVALRTIGRDDTAEVLDRLFAELQWRALLQASPGGADDVARLEVLLDWIGDADADGRGVDAVMQLFGDGADVPRVRLDRATRTITCTTIFQSKGLAWDHVALLSPGRSGRLEPDVDTDLWMEIDGQRKRIVGLTFDPEGGLLAYQDPLRRLAASMLKARYAEEGIRLAYVGVTRARRSVTLGLPDKPTRMALAQRLICDAWRGLDHPTVRRIPPPPEAARHQVSSSVVHPTQPAFPALDRTSPPHFMVLPPSSAAARFTPEEQADFADHLATRVALAGGRIDGHGDVEPPRARWPEFTPADWGTLVHGWFAAWGFRSALREAAIGNWLALECGGDDPAIRGWLLRISEQLVARGGPIWELVQADDVRLHFEVPVIGLGGPRDDLYLAGRPDLVVARGKRLVIVDFKAGFKSPMPGSDLVESASLKLYGPQLEAYREVLERSGFTVDRTVLWFVRSGAVVQW